MILTAIFFALSAPYAALLALCTHKVHEAAGRGSACGSGRGSVCGDVRGSVCGSVCDTAPFTVVVCTHAEDPVDVVRNLCFLRLRPCDALIVVADGRTPYDVALLRGRMAALAAGRPFSISVIENTGPRGKKGALRTGVEAARSEWVVGMDADCRVGCHFAQGVADAAAAMPREGGLVLLPVLMEAQKNASGTDDASDANDASDIISPSDINARAPRRAPLFAEMVEAEFACLQMVTAGTAMAGHPTMANGAGMLFGRALFLGHDAHSRYASGDDMFLLQHCVLTGARVRYAADVRCLVRTDAPATLDAYLRQRARWLGKAGGYTMTDVKLVALAVLAANTAWPVAALCAAAGACGWGGAAMLFGLKLMLETGLYAAARGMLDSKVRFSSILALAFLYPLMIFAVAWRAARADKGKW